MDILLTTACALYLLAFLLGEVLWLRAVAVVAAAIGATHYALPGSADAILLSLHVAAGVVNAVYLVRGYAQFGSSHLGERDRALYELSFTSLTPRDFARILAVGSRDVAVPGDTLVRPGVTPGALMLIESGRVGVHVGRGALIQLLPGQFIGEMSFLAQSVPAARVVAMEPARLVTWPVDALRTLLASDPRLEGDFHRVLGMDVVEKLRAEGALNLPSRPVARAARHEDLIPELREPMGGLEPPEPMTVPLRS